MADSNELIFEIKFDIQKMQGDIAKIKSSMNTLETTGRDAFKSISDEATMQAEAISSAFSKVGAVVGGIFSVGAAKQFLGQVINIRSEFQDTEARFKVFLGNEQKAAEFMSQLSDYAYWNTFEFKDLAAQSAQLLAFKNNVEDVIPTIDMLSNIASGTGVELERLVSVWNKVKSVDKIDSMTNISLKGMGIDVAQVLADAGEQVDETTLKFEDLKKAIETITGEGGLYHGIMEAKMETSLSDQVGLLQDSITAMFNEIGESSQGAIKDLLLFANSAVQHYKEIGEVLTMLISIYGSYKVAMAISHQLYMQEKAALEASLTTKNASMDADLAAAVAKGKLTAAEAAEIQSLRAAMQEKLKSAQATLAQAQAEEKAAKASYKSATQKHLLAKQNLAVAQSQMYIAVKTGTIEEQQAARIGVINAKMELQNAAIAKNNAHKALAATTTTKLAAAETVEATAKQVSTVATGAEITKTTLLTAAKAGLQKVTAALNKTVLSNPYALVAAAIILLIKKIYEMATATTAAEDAMKEFQEETSKAEANARLLFNEMEMAGEGTETYKKALAQLKKEYPQYLKDQLDEVGNLRNIKEARDKVIAGIREEMALKIEQKALEEAYSRQVEAELDLVEGAISKFSDREITVNGKKTKLTDNQKSEVAKLLVENVKNNMSAYRDYYNTQGEALKSGFEQGAKIDKYNKAKSSLADQISSLLEISKEDATNLISRNFWDWKTLDSYISGFIDDYEEAGKDIDEIKSKFSALGYGGSTVGAGGGEGTGDGGDDAALTGKKRLEKELADLRENFEKTERTAADFRQKKAAYAKEYIRLTREIADYDINTSKGGGNDDKFNEELKAMSNFYKDALSLMQSTDSDLQEEGRTMYEEFVSKYGAASLSEALRTMLENETNNEHKKTIALMLNDETKINDEYLKKRSDIAKRFAEKNSSIDEMRMKFIMESDASTLDAKINFMKEQNEKDLAKTKENIDKYLEELEKIAQERDRAEYAAMHPEATRNDIDSYVNSKSEERKAELEERKANLNKDAKDYYDRQLLDNESKLWDEQLKKYKSFTDKYVQLTKEKNDKVKNLEKKGANQSVIDAVNKDYDEQLKALSEGLDPQQVKELTDTLNGMLGMSLEQMIDLSKKLGKELKDTTDSDKTEKLQRMKAALDKLIQTITETPEKKSALQTLIEGVFGKDPQEFINNVKEAYDAITSLVGAMGDLNEVEAINMETGSKILGDMASVVANVASENYVGAAVSAISIITDTLEGNTRAAKAKFQATLDGWEHYADVNIKKIKRHIDELNESRDNVVGIEQYIKSRVIFTDYQKEIRVLERQKEELQKLLEQSNLTDEQRKQTEEQIADIDDQIYETEKAITAEKEKQMEQLTGYSNSAEAVTAFGDAIISAWENGTSAADSALGTWEDMIKQFAKQKFLSDFMSKQFEGIFNEYYDLIDGGNMISEEQQVNFRNQITELAENGKEFYNSLMESMGIANDIALEGTKGSGIAKASQESIDELNGRFLSVQMFTASISGSVERLYQNSTSIMRDVSDIRGFQENISGKIDAMKGYMQDIVNNGIRMN